MLIYQKTIADDVNLTKQLQTMLILQKTIADDVNFTQNSCRRC